VHATLSEAFDNYHADANGAPDSPPSYSSVLDADNDDKSSTHASPNNAPEQHREGNVVTQSGFPDREYITTVSTQSGSISGTFPLGARTAIDSRSGSLSGVELVVMPTNVSASRRLSTISQDGSQSVRITEDYFLAGKRKSWWEGMLAKHESRSGSISVEYPDSWEGTIDVETESGSISVTGRGVVIIREGRGRVVAQKGEEGGGRVIARAGSGKVDLRFG